MSRTPSLAALRARVAALGVKAERQEEVALALELRLAALAVVPWKRLEELPPAITFQPHYSVGASDDD